MLPPLQELQGRMKEVVVADAKRCTYCHRIGHEVAECRVKRERETNSVKSTVTPSTVPPTSDTRTCYNCGKLDISTENVPFHIDPRSDSLRGQPRASTALLTTKVSGRFHLVTEEWKVKPACYLMNRM